MKVKNTYTIPVIWDPDTEGNTAKQIATSGREVTHIKLIASGAASTVFLYDNNTSTANVNDLRWIMDASQEATDRDTLSHPIVFKKGIYAVLMSGEGFRPILAMAVLHDQV